MCGIAGYLGSPKCNLDILNNSFSKAIRYRGRDNEGEWFDRGVAHLFHSRLSIIDLQSGAQPMHDFSGRFVIVFNGEIYNYLELQEEYIRLGARFTTNSDTEVILEGFRLKGKKVFEDLNGMFAFAIWDKLERRLFIARDRLGKKPLYYTEINGNFYFSSSIDSFREVPGWTAKLSRLNLDAYAALGNYLPGETAFQQVKSLPPASYASIENGKSQPVISKYWKLDFSNKYTGSIENALEEFEKLISDAVSIRLRADVPVALTFSGGVDSGIIAAVAKQRLNKSLSCWTIDYHTKDDESEETIIAEKVASILNLEWHYQNFDYKSELVSSLREAMNEFDQPCGHIAISYSRLLYKSIQPHAKVVLTGNGADELFLGYDGNEDLYKKDLIWSQSRLSAIIQSVFPGSLMKRYSRGMKLANYQADYIRANVHRYADEPDPEEKIEKIMNDIFESNINSYADLYTYMGLRFYTNEANFRIPDITGLSEQVEVRSPFLDYRVVDFAARLPTEMKIGDYATQLKNKYFLKKYYEKFVPANIAWSKKKGMGWNLKYGKTLATDSQLDKTYQSCLVRIKDAGLPCQKYAKAREKYINDIHNGIDIPSTAGMMSSGLMLGLWLDRNR